MWLGGWIRLTLSDDELTTLRDWIYHTVGNAIEIVEQRENEVLNKTIKTEPHEKKGDNLY